MPSSLTFLAGQTKEVEEEQWLARDRGRRPTSSPRSRPKSRLEILMMDIARSQEQKLDGFARSIEHKIDELTRGYADQVAYTVGRISSVEVSLEDPPRPSANPGRRGSSSSAETMHVCVPSTNGFLVPLSQSEVRSERLLLKPRPDYRLLNRSAIRPDKSITAIGEDA